MQAKILLFVVLCLGILAGYCLLRDAVLKQDSADALPATQVFSQQKKTGPNDTITQLQQRLF